MNMPSDRAREALRQCLPDALKDQSFANLLRTEDAVQRWLAHLIKNITETGPAVGTSPLLAPQATPQQARPAGSIWDSK
jgi:hypothetical protein